MAPGASSLRVLGAAGSATTMRALGSISPDFDVICNACPGTVGDFEFNVVDPQTARLPEHLRTKHYGTHTPFSIAIRPAQSDIAAHLEGEVREPPSLCVQTDACPQRISPASATFDQAPAACAKQAYTRDGPKPVQ